MQISFCPQRRDDALDANVSGDTITINGGALDFSPVPDGCTVNAGDVPCEWITGTVERIGGEIHLTLILPHGPNPPQEIAFPQPVTVTNGAVILPGDE